MTPEQKEALRQALQQLYNDLNDAYWVAGSLEGKDLINGCAHALYEVLTELEVENFTAGTPAFAKLKGDLDAVNKKLTQLKQQIDKIIHKIDTATKVISSVNKVISIAAPLLL